MKNLFFLIMVSLFGLIVACSPDSEGTDSSSVPAPVKEAFERSNKEVKDMKWYMKGEKYEAVYKENGLERAVVYDASGNMVMSEVEILEEDLPLIIRTYLSESYEGSPILEVEKITNGEGVFYDIDLKADEGNKELIFDEEGNLVSDDLEGEEDDDDEDDNDDED